MTNGKGEFKNVNFRDCTIQDFIGNEDIFKRDGGELQALKCPENLADLKVKNNQYSTSGADWT